MMHGINHNDMMIPMKRRNVIRILIVCICLLFSGHFACSILTPARISTYHYGTSEFLDNDYTDTSIAELNESVSENARDHYIIPKGNGKDTVTVLFYIIGSDEPSSSATTISTLNNILYANDSENVNILIQTGGSSSWNSKILKDGAIQRWTVEKDSPIEVDCTIDTESMCDPQTLYEFIKYGMEYYPSDRTFLFLSGSGSPSSFGYDPDGIHTDLSYTAISSVLNRIDQPIDMICMDAPYAATYENALLMEPYADYMVAFETGVSQEGILYQSFLSRLASDSSASSLSLGKLLIDSYALNQAQKSSRSSYVLSLIDLAEIRYINDHTLSLFGEEMKTILENGTFQTICDIFSSTAKVSDNRIDFTHFARRLSLSSASDLFEQMSEMIRYRRASQSANMYGISCPSLSDHSSSILFPQAYLDFINLFDMYQALGDTLKSLTFASLADQLTDTPFISEEITAETLIESDLFHTSFPDYAHYDSDTLHNAASWIINTSLSPSILSIRRRNDQYLLPLDETNRLLLHDVQMAAFVPYGSAYITLGTLPSDSLTYDEMPLFPDHPQWYYFNDQPIPITSFTTDSFGNTSVIIHALLNGEEVFLRAEKDTLGLRLEFKDAYVICQGSSVTPKGTRNLQETDEITFLYDVYGSDGNLSGTFTCYNPVSISDSPHIEKRPLATAKISFCLQDYRGSLYYSQMMPYPVTASH